MKRLFFALAFAMQLSAQWQTFSVQTGASNLSTAMDGKMNWQASTVACADKNGTVGRDMCIDTGTLKIYKVTVTGTPATWTDVAATAAALAATPSLCTAGQAPTGVLANGNATGCAAWVPTGALIVNAAPQSIPYNSLTAVILGTVASGSAGAYTGTANALTAPATGIYTVSMGNCWDSSIPNGAQMRLLINGTVWPYMTTGIVGQPIFPCVSAAIVLPLNSGDKVTMQIYQANPGLGALNNDYAFLSMRN